MATFFRRITAMLFAIVLVLVAAPSMAQYDEAITIKNPRTGKEFTFSSIALKNLKLLEDVLDELQMNEHLETLQGVMLVETRAGTGGSIGLPEAHWTRRSYGLMQITLPTARVILRDNPDILQQYFGRRTLASITLDELKRFLLTNKRANVHLGAVLFKQYLDIVKGEWARAVAAYNMGIGNALKRKEAPKAKYVRDVRDWQGYVKALNKELKLAREQAQPSIVPSAFIQTPPVDLFPTTEDTEITLHLKEKNNGEGEEVQRQTNEESQRAEQPGRAEEVEDGSGYYYTSLPSDRRSEGSDQGDDRRSIGFIWP